MPYRNACWLGIDLSTQSLTVALIPDGIGKPPVAVVSVNFAKDLPQYNTTNGMYIGEDPAVVTSPVTMWLDALDMGLMRLKAVPAAASHLPNVFGVSVSGQQHGTVYWRVGASYHLRSLGGVNPHITLSEALRDCFIIRDCPIWADSSAVEQCEALEAALGGPEALAKATGSAAYPRFSGNQIAKIAAKSARAWSMCERVSLVSSFLTSVLIGAYAPIDRSDGSGMNLMDIRREVWHEGAMKATGAECLEHKLGHLVDSHEVVGTLSHYFTAKYGLPEKISVVAGSGDNPNALAAMGLDGFDSIAISLGTSDTVMGITTTPVPQVEGHIMASPLDPSAYFAMLVYKNGSLTREAVRNETCEGDWNKFDEAIKSTPPGCNGKLALLIDLPEITPQVPHIARHFASVSDPHAPLESSQLSPQELVRAAVEGRFLSMKERLQTMGVKGYGRIYAVGGASSNSAITQVMSDVFGVPVYVNTVPDAAAIGAAMRAKHGVISSRTGTRLSFRNICFGPEDKRELILAASPNTAASEVYTPMLKAYKILEDRAAGKDVSDGMDLDGGGMGSPGLKRKGSPFKGGDHKREKIVFSPVKARSVLKPPEEPGTMSYKSAGVDSDAQEELLERIQPAWQSTRRPGVQPEPGGMKCGFDFDLEAAGYGGEDSLLVAKVDGVGTKLKVAQAVGSHSGVGVDLVAVCVNELLARGAEPLFFLDYYASGDLSIPDAAAVVEGITEGCREARCALVGGEMAQMPSLYPPGMYDLAGFLVGAVVKSGIMPRGVHAGDYLLGLQSSGLHSNGFSLVRKIIEVAGINYGDPTPYDPSITIAEALLEPTKIYVKQVLPLLKEGLLHAVAHVSKGGVLQHLAHVLPENLVASIDADAAGWSLPPIFKWIQQAGNVEKRELLEVFNCGVGMILVCPSDKLSRVQAHLVSAGERALVLGRVEHRPSKFCPQVMVYGHLCPLEAAAAAASGKEPPRITYMSSGIHLDVLRQLQKRIEPVIARTGRSGSVTAVEALAAIRGGEVLGSSPIGGLFNLASAGHMPKESSLVASVDTIGTKLKVAQLTNNLSNVGVDLVAMCVNDVVARGAEPLFMLQYYSTGELKLDDAASVVESVARGCQEANVALLDTETSELPSMYMPGEYDIAGAAVGASDRRHLLPQAIAVGDVLLGLPSSGLHCNGFSLVRKVCEKVGLAYTATAPWVEGGIITVGESFLTPTRIYVRHVLPLHKKGLLRGAAHVSGGGIEAALSRALPEGMAACVNLDGWRLPGVFNWLREVGGVKVDELLRTFNCGVGMVLVAAPGDVDAICGALSLTGEPRPLTLGTVTAFNPLLNGARVQFSGELKI